MESEKEVARVSGLSNSGFVRRDELHFRSLGENTETLKLNQGYNGENDAATKFSIYLLQCLPCRLSAMRQNLSAVKLIHD